MSGITIGVITGIGYALLGFGKNKKQDPGTKFKWLQLFKTVIICGVVGGIAGWQGLDLGSFTIIMNASLGITTTKIIDTLWHFFVKKQD